MARDTHNSNSKRNERTRKNRNSKFKMQIRKKMYFFLFTFFAALLYVGIYQVYDIKYVSGKDYEARAIYNQVNKIQDKIINPNRGSILDRNKQALAISYTVYNIIIDIRNMYTLEEKDREKILNELSSSLDIDIAELKDYFKLNPDGTLVNDTSYKIIKKEVPYNDGKELQAKELKCVYLEEDTKRTYPHDSLAAQVIGFIRGDSSWGLESRYNDEMIGTPGRIFRTYESDNSIVTRQEPAQEGYTLVTTIDQTIQQYLEKAVKEAFDAYNPENTSAIAMNPMTGEILGMASYPTFNVNRPELLSYFENPEYQKTWDTMPDEEKSKVSLKCWRNFNISDTFEPGSIFKPIVVAAALEEGVIRTTDTYFCNGKKVYGEDEIKCHKTAGHGTESLTGVLANSCNVGMMDIVSKLGRNKFYKYQRDFGFGEKTGIDLPAEASGILYSVDQLNTVELATSSFGQGFNSTAIQSINGFAAAINGGNLLKPYIVSQIIDRNGNIIKETNTEIVRKVISSETSDYLRKALEDVVNGDGTGKKARIDGYAIGGKTGTAEQGKRGSEIYTLSFIAYLTVDNPDIMVAIFIHKPIPYIEGQTTPAPMLKDILTNIINYKAIPPSYDSNSENNDINENTEVIIGDYNNKSLQETIQSLNAMGVDFELVGGSGDMVTKQFPAANSKITKTTKVLLYISPTSETELVLVPDVVGMPVDQAQQTIEGSGFQCSVEEIASIENGALVPSEEENKVEESTEQNVDDNSETNAGTGKTVVEQIPASGVKITNGSIIKIKVS